MGRKLNLSQAADDAGIARPTLRRHVRGFEEMCGRPLFFLDGQSYRVSEFGHRLLPLIEGLLRQSRQLVSPAAAWLGELRYGSVRVDGNAFLIQQHPLNRLWSHDVPTLHRGLQRWTDARGALEAEAWGETRDELVVLRRGPDEWVCVSVGEQSALARWLGWEWAKSAVGKPMAQNPIGNEANELLLAPLDHVASLGGVWYDHVSATFRRPGETQWQRVTYQRLVYACTFPDGSVAVATQVETTDRIDIHEPQASHADRPD